MDEKFDKAEPQVEEDLTTRLKKIKNFHVTGETQTLEIKVTNITNYCASLKIILPMLLIPLVVMLILALTGKVMWVMFYFVAGIFSFTFLAATCTLLFNKKSSRYVVSKTAILRTISGTTWVAEYGNIKEVKSRRSLFFKNGGSISFKLYKGSGINLQFYLLSGFKETCELIDLYRLGDKEQQEFERLFPNDRFNDLLDYVNYDSAKIDKLPNCLKVYYIMWTLYDAQFEAGFDEFFINSPEITDKQLLQACRLLDLPELTELCKRALALNEKYDIAHNDDLPEECSEELNILNDEFLDLDVVYRFEDRFKRYYVDNYEKFDFE